MGLIQKRPLELIKDDEVREQIKDIQENVTGNVIALSAAPTATAPLLEDGERGTFENKWYSRVGSVIHEFTPSQNITIT